MENSIVHGLKNEPGLIRISISRTADFLMITIADNGCGMTSEKLAKIRLSQELGLESSSSGGYGLVNIQERLLSYYGDNTRMNISSQIDVGTVIEIALPIEKTNA